MAGAACTPGCEDSWDTVMTAATRTASTTMPNAPSTADVQRCPLLKADDAVARSRGRVVAFMEMAVTSSSSWLCGRW